jgi:hypothetical protein
MKKGSTLLITASLIVLLLVLGVLDALTVEKDLTGMLTSSSQDSERKRGDLETMFAHEGFEVRDGSEPSFLSSMTSPTEISSRVLLEKNDRAGFVVWIETENTKALFFALKRALVESFSDEVKDLTDENTETVSVVSFLDPQISEERFIILLAGNRILEFHIPLGKEERFLSVIHTLSQRE